MTCKECEHFKILYEPIKHFDRGRAVCEKNDLIKDFMSHRELDRLKCVEEEQG